MRRYRISIFGGGESSIVELDLRPTEFKTVERVSALLLQKFEGSMDDHPWMDVEEVKK